MISLFIALIKSLLLSLCKRCNGKTFDQERPDSISEGAYRINLSKHTLSACLNQTGLLIIIIYKSMNFSHCTIYCSVLSCTRTVLRTCSTCVVLIAQLTTNAYYSYTGTF